MKYDMRAPVHSYPMISRMTWQEGGICGDRVLTWLWDREEDDDMECGSDESQSSIEDFGDSNANSDDGFSNIKRRENTSNFEENGQEALLHDSTPSLTDKPKRKISGSHIDDRSGEKVSGTQSRHVDLVKGNSGFRSSVNGSKWERVELWGSEGKQIGRTDERWSNRHHSHTVAFRRIID